MDTHAVVSQLKNQVNELYKKHFFVNKYMCFGFFYMFLEDLKFVWSNFFDVRKRGYSDNFTVQPDKKTDFIFIRQQEEDIGQFGNF